MVQEEPITLIDDSGKKFSDTVGKSGRVFDVVSGSLNLGSSSPPSIDSRYTSGSTDGRFIQQLDKDMVYFIQTKELYY